MKLITRAELYELPVGSILSNGELVCIDDMFVYHGRIVHDDTPTPTDDFWVTNLSICLPPEIANPPGNISWSEQYKQMTTGFEVLIRSCSVSRDGLYEEEAVFWLWEKNDLEKLHACITTALALHK